ncbi:oxygenase MpaB family protein [Labrys monachus]|uniref:Uncharacterized protein (DUF2236 family) n=1 Tax=Labrys monachus TaxID=217067 RepID=A0ABU0FL34_9HYPH|nr:oxygenase MpaB family protein [Labrys monachus]MDQ0395318.1 uncharacterized protein (DUF2236 family) [Labrys monachus]
MLDALQALMGPPKGMDVDFETPPGAPALAPADGISWQIFSNPIALFIGGVAAVLLELAEPSVRSGVWEHSGFRSDPATRLRRTGYAAMVTVYAPREEAERMIAHVVRAHDRVRGTTPGGKPYHANDPVLLDWVQATAIWGFAEAFHRYARRLTANEKSAAFREGEAAARLYGATGAPGDWAAWDALLAGTAPRLEDHAILAEFLDIMAGADILPAPLRPLQRLLIRAAVSLTPEPVRSLPSLEGRGLRFGEAGLVRMLGRAARLIPLANLPPAQARRRVAALPMPATGH